MPSSARLVHSSSGLAVHRTVYGHLPGSHRAHLCAGHVEPKCLNLLIFVSLAFLTFLGPLLSLITTRPGAGMILSELERIQLQLWDVSILQTVNRVTKLGEADGCYQRSKER